MCEIDKLKVDIEVIGNRLDSEERTRRERAMLKIFNFAAMYGGGKTVRFYPPVPMTFKINGLARPN